MQKISLEEIKRLRQLNATFSQKITILEKNDKLQKKIIRELEKSNKLSKELIQNQQDEIETLKLQIEELNKIVFKPKKEKITNIVKKVKKKRSKSSYQRIIPKDSDITQEFNHRIDSCPKCNSKLVAKKKAVFYIEDINLENKLKVIEKHNVEKGYCNKCRKYHNAIEIPSSKVVIGKNTKMYVTYLTILLRNSYSQIVKLFKDTYNFKLSEGEISNILNTEAQSLKSEFERLKESIRNQKGIHMDETPWKVHNGNLGNYAWIMTGTDTEDVVFDIGKSRGRQIAKKLQGNTKLIGISDDYNAYKKLFSLHQLCWAHPHRKLRDLAMSDKLEEKTKNHCNDVYLEFKKLYNELQEILKTDFDLKKRKKIEQEFKKRLIQISKYHKKDPKKLENIKKGLLRNQDKYFICLLNEKIPADNNKAERGLRHLVLKRKISFGSMTQKGADRLSILTSVLLSLWNKNPNKFFKSYLEMKN